MKLTFTILSVSGLVAAQNYNYSSPSASGPTTSAASSSVTAAPSAASSATPSPNIPSDISPSCSSFLDTLNKAPGIQSCVEPLLDVMAANSTASISSICTTASSSSCSDPTIRMWLAYFSGNCTAEVVTSPNKNVVAIYDLMYSLKPFLNAVCAKDASGQYCLSQSAANGTTKTPSGITNAAQTPLTNSDGTINAKAFNSANVLWLGANPNMNVTALCTMCTKNVLTSYIQFESAMPPITSIYSLPLLSSQPALWAAVQKTCPANFISGALSNAGATPNVANGASTSSPAKAAMLILAVATAGVMSL